MKKILPSTYRNPVFPYKRSTDQNAGKPMRHQVVIVGAGPTGLAAALALANAGIPSVVLSKEETVSIGSRAICFSKKTLEVVNRISRRAAERMLEKGITWNVGKVFYDKNLVYEFNLLPEEGHQFPAFINLQQYYFEEYLVDEILENSLIDLRWHNELTEIIQDKEKVSIIVQTPEGPYQLEAEYLLACDGVNSCVRQQLGIPFEGESFQEHFLITDIVMEKDFPTERWFWFDPPFNRGYSALLHKQPDGVWRIDQQLGPDADKNRELDPERIKARLRRMLGNEVKFELEWASIYQFRCMRVPEFVQGRVLFAGDSAHLVSPFGARGANGAVQDVDNLNWKLEYVLKGLAPASLLDTYHEERSPAADENIRYSAQATDFITPKSAASLCFRNAALELAARNDKAKRLINSGRLSHPFKYLNSPLTSPDTDQFACSLQPGCTAPDAPLRWNGSPRWLLDEIGNRFVLLFFTDSASASLPEGISSLKALDIPFEAVCISSGLSARNMLVDARGLFAGRYDATPGAWYLFRPDQHIAARGRRFSVDKVKSAMEKATGRTAAAPGAGIEDRMPVYTHDDLYNRLVKAHDGLSREDSERLNAKIILLLLEKVQNDEEWAELLKAAKGNTAGIP